MSGLVSATLHIRADSNKNYLQIYFFKPLTLILIILICFLQRNEVSSSYKQFILFGLILSMVGDGFLMMRKNHFINGLLAFLIAHIFYLVALLTNYGFKNNLIILIPIVVYFLFFLKIIIPNTGSKKLYVTFYAFIIMFLLWQGLSRMSFELNNSAILFGLGVSLFTISDTILAYNKFVKSFQFGQLLILSTYYVAQLLIALSV